jgi:exodeoxyribonuclease VII small subunit
MKEKEKSFETNLKELEKIVHELETGNVPLEDAIKKYTEAMELAKSCNDKLNDATEKVNKILSEDGNLKDFEVKEDN